MTTVKLAVAGAATVRLWGSAAKVEATTAAVTVNRAAELVTLLLAPVTTTR